MLFYDESVFSVLQLFLFEPVLSDNNHRTLVSLFIYDLTFLYYYTLFVMYILSDYILHPYGWVEMEIKNQQKVL